MVGELRIYWESAWSYKPSKLHIYQGQEAEMNGQKMAAQSIPTPRNESQFYATLRRYTQRLKQQRDISLGYLNRVNELEGQLRAKDVEIDRLARLNRQLSEKLSLYSSVLERSQAKRPLRMSMILGTTNMTESIIETKQESHWADGAKPFEQFFIADLGDLKKGSIKYRFLYRPLAEQEQLLLNHFTNSSSPEWEIQPVAGSKTQRRPHFVYFLANSPYTCKNNSAKDKELQLIQKVNPSLYYFTLCMVQKELVNVNGKLLWIPIVYGFVTLVPFPDFYFRLLDEIAQQPKIRNEIDLKKLNDSLNELNKCVVEPFTQERYMFMNKAHIWKIPEPLQIDSYALTFSLGIIEKSALELIIDVLILLLLEIPITIVSQDQLSLSKFMFYFLYIIKPLKYPYPIVFNVTEKLKDLLQQPFPTFTGCVDHKIVEPFLNERAVFDLDKKVAKSWPMLDHLDSSRDFLMRMAHQIGNYTRFSAITEEIIKGHQYRELEPYWNDFSKTQLYKNYMNKV